MAINKRDTARLELARERLLALCDPRLTNCAVKSEHKDAVRPYVESWVISLLTDVLAGNEDRWDVKGQTAIALGRCRRDREAAGIDEYGMNVKAVKPAPTCPDGCDHKWNTNCVLSCYEAAK